jgi:hypothetical protein
MFYSVFVPIAVLVSGFGIFLIATFLCWKIDRLQEEVALLKQQMYLDDLPDGEYELNSLFYRMLSMAGFADYKIHPGVGLMKLYVNGAERFVQFREDQFSGDLPLTGQVIIRVVSKPGELIKTFERVN